MWLTLVYPLISTESLSAVVHFVKTVFKEPLRFCLVCNLKNLEGFLKVGLIFSKHESDFFVLQTDTKTTKTRTEAVVWLCDTVCRYNCLNGRECRKESRGWDEGIEREITTESHRRKRNE